MCYPTVGSLGRGDGGSRGNRTLFSRLRTKRPSSSVDDGAVFEQDGVVRKDSLEMFAMRFAETILVFWYPFSESNGVVLRCRRRAFPSGSRGVWCPREESNLLRRALQTLALPVSYSDVFFC